MKKLIGSLLLGGALVLGSGLESKAQSTNFVKGPITNNTNYSVVEQQEWLIQASSANPTYGSVSGNINDWIIHGSNATFTAVPNAGNHGIFTSWSDGNTNLARTVAANGASNYVANFDIERFNVNIAGGTPYGLNPTNFVGVPYGGSVTSTAPNAVYTNAPGSRKRIIGLQ